MIPYAKDRFSKENVNIFTLLVSDYQNNWEYYYIHSIEQLYHILLSYIEPAVEKIPQGNKFKIETESFIQDVAKLNNCIHNLDVHSMAFRFPSVERPLALKMDSIVEALKLYYSTDAFLTNAVKVLMYSGYLEVGDDKLAEFYY